jgi:hypothetical protein
MSQNAEKIIDYLKTHPLYLEILFVLVEERRTTATSIATLLGRKSVSTIFEPLKYMRDEFKILKSEKVGKNTYFYPTNIKEIKELIEMKELREAFSRVKSKLATAPRFVQRKLQKELERELIKQEGIIKVISGLEKKIPISIEGVLGESKLDFIFTILSKSQQARLKVEKNIGIIIKHIYYPSLNNPFFEMSGEIINIIKSAPEHIQRFGGILVVCLLLPSRLPTSRFHSAEIDKWKLKELIQSLGTKTIKTDLLLQQVGEDDLINPLYIKNLTEEIVANAKKLAQ